MKKKYLKVMLSIFLVVGLYTWCNQAVSASENSQDIVICVEDYNKTAKELASSDFDARTYTDHKMKHASMVFEKSQTLVEVLPEYLKKNKVKKTSSDLVQLSENIDYAVALTAPFFHDTGMSGNGYTMLLDENGKYVTKDDGSYVVVRENNSIFSEVRTNHSINSGLYVLVNRNLFLEEGYTDRQIDEMAIVCMAHSKSNSGVKNINSAAQWKDCFARLRAVVDKYNEDHADMPITFHEEFFTSEEDFARIASETLMIRLADVSRDSGPDAESQSGESIHVDLSTLNNQGGSVEEEMRNARVTISGEIMESILKRQIHSAEQNIVGNTAYVDEAGNFVQEITIEDGCRIPYCMQETLNDYAGELATAKEYHFTIALKFNQACDDYAKKAYDGYRISIAEKYPNVTFVYPWD